MWISIRGIVRSAVDSSPVPGAIVEDLSSPGPIRTCIPGVNAPAVRSRTDGSFHLHGLPIADPIVPPGTMRKVLITAEGFWPWGKAYDAGSPLPEIMVRLRPCGMIRGTVRSRNGLLLAGSHLTGIPRGVRPLDLESEGLDPSEEPFICERIPWPALPEATTDAEGRFVLFPLAFDRDYLVCVSPRQGVGWRERIPVRPDDDHRTIEVQIVVDDS